MFNRSSNRYDGFLVIMPSIPWQMGMWAKNRLQRPVRQTHHDGLISDASADQILAKNSCERNYQQCRWFAMIVSKDLDNELAILV